MAQEIKLLQKEGAGLAELHLIWDVLSTLKTVYLMDAMAIFANGPQDSSQFSLCQDA